MSGENKARNRWLKASGRRSSILKRQDTCFLTDATETESVNTPQKRRVSFASTATVRTFETLPWQSHSSDDSGSSSVNHIEDDVFEPRPSLLLNVKPHCPSEKPPADDNSSVSPQKDHLDVKEQDKTIMFSQFNESACAMEITTNVSQLSNSWFENENSVLHENSVLQDDKSGNQHNRFVLDVTNDSEPHVIFPWNVKGMGSNDVEKTQIFLSSDDDNMEFTRNMTGFPSIFSKFQNTEHGSDILHQEKSKPHVIFPWNDKGMDNVNVEKTQIFASSDDNNMEFTHIVENSSDILHQENFPKQLSGDCTMADDMTADMEMTDIIETVSVPKRRSVLVDLTVNKNLTPIEEMSVSSMYASMSGHEQWAQQNKSLNLSQVCAKLEVMGADKSNQSVRHDSDDEDSLQNSISLSEIAGLKSPPKQSNTEADKSINEKKLGLNSVDNSLSFISSNSKRSPSRTPSSYADENVSKVNSLERNQVIEKVNESVDVEKKCSPHKISLISKQAEGQSHCNQIDERDCQTPKDALDNAPLNESVQVVLPSMRSTIAAPIKDDRQVEDVVQKDVFEPNSDCPNVKPSADNSSVSPQDDHPDVKRQEKTIMFSQFNESVCGMEITSNVSQLSDSCFDKENSLLQDDKNRTQNNCSALDISNDSKPRVMFPWNAKGMDNVEKTQIFASSDDNNMEFTHIAENGSDVLRQENFPKQLSGDYAMADDMTADMEMTDIIETVSVPKRRSVLVDLAENKNLTPIEEMSVSSMYAAVSDHQNKNLNFSQFGGAKLETLETDKDEQSVRLDDEDISLSEIAGLKSPPKQSNTETEKSINKNEPELNSLDNSVSFINKNSPSEMPLSCADENASKENSLRSNEVIDQMNKSVGVDNKISPQKSTAVSEQTKKREALRKSLCDQMMFPNLASKSFNSKSFSYLAKPNTVEVAKINHDGLESTPKKPEGETDDQSRSSGNKLEENKTKTQPRLDNMRLSSDFFEGVGLLDEGDCPTLEDAFIPLNDSVQEELVFSYMRSFIEAPGDVKDGNGAEDVVRENLEFSDICQTLGIEYNSEQRNAVITQPIPDSSACDKLNANLIVRPQIETLEKYVGQLQEEYSKRQKMLKDSFGKFSHCPIYKDVKIATKQGLDVSAIKTKAQDMSRACKRSSYSKQNSHRADYLMDLTFAQQKGHDQQKKNLETILSDIERVANVSAEIDKRLEDMNVFSETRSEIQQLQRKTVQIESETCQMKSHCDKLCREIEVLNKVSKDRLLKIKDDEEEELILLDKISFMSCLSEWSVLKQNKTKWTVGFLSNTIVLDVNLSDTKTPHQKILDISFRSRLSSKSTLWAKISHQLLLSSLDREALMRRFQNLNSLISHVSDLAGVSRDLCAELKDVHLKHQLEGKGLSIHIQLLSRDCQQAIEMVTTLQPGSYTTQPLDWETSVLLSSLSSTSVVDALRQVTPGPKYITRSLEAVLSLMAV